MTDVYYFTCLWNKHPTAWLSTKPYRDGFEIGSVKWRGRSTIIKIVYGSEPTLNKSKAYYPPDLYALLKSNLQKQIRRQKLTAVATAAELWNLCQFELLRRLIVIAAEDVEVTVETAVITWLMTAKSKGLVLTNKHRDWVLGYVKELVEHPVCRRLEFRAEQDRFNSLLLVDKVLDTHHPQAEQIAGILFRTAYGGLKSDPPMISRCLDWLLQNDTKLLTFNVVKWNKPLPKLLVNKAAIDHHIWAELVDELVASYPQYSSNFIATVIWECSSGVNKRCSIPVNKDLRQCWEIIKQEFYSLISGYLTRILCKYGGLAVKKN